MTMEAIAKHDFNATADDELSFRQDHWKDYIDAHFLLSLGAENTSVGHYCLFLFVLNLRGGRGKYIEFVCFDLPPLES